MVRIIFGSTYCSQVRSIGLISISLAIISLRPRENRYTRCAKLERHPQSFYCQLFNRPAHFLFVFHINGESLVEASKLLKVDNSSFVKRYCFFKSCLKLVNPSWHFFIVRNRRSGYIRIFTQLHNRDGPMLFDISSRYFSVFVRPCVLNMQTLHSVKIYKC